MEADDTVAAPRVAGARVLWYAFAFAALISGFFLILGVSFKLHTDSQRNICVGQLMQIEMSLLQYRMDYRLFPPDLAGISKKGSPLRDPWGRAFVYRLQGDRKRLYSTGPDGLDAGGKGDDVGLE